MVLCCAAPVRISAWQRLLLIGVIASWNLPIDSRKLRAEYDGEAWHGPTIPESLVTCLV